MTAEFSQDLDTHCTRCANMDETLHHVVVGGPHL